MANYVRGCCDVCVRERETEVCTSWNQWICTSLMERYVSHREAHASSGLSSHTTE